jgi:WD40 repeat protein
VSSTGLESLKDLAVSGSQKLEDYQKVTEWSPSGTHILAAATDGSIAIFEYPTWNKILFYQPSTNADQSQHHGANEILDGSWDPSGRQVATVSGRKLLVYSANDGSIVQDIPPGDMNGKVPCEFRQCK